eukprot:gene3714-4280_t
MSQTQTITATTTTTSTTGFAGTTINASSSAATSNASGSDHKMLSSSIDRDNTKWIEAIHGHVVDAMAKNKLSSAAMEAAHQHPLPEHMLLQTVFLSKFSYITDEPTEYVELLDEHGPSFRSISIYKPRYTRTKIVVAVDYFDTMYVAFTGSIDERDVILDVACGLQEKLHYRNGHSIYESIARTRWITDAVPNLLAIARAASCRMLVFCGHSMGGSAATAATLRAIQIRGQNRSNWLPIKCFTFGAPSYFHEATRSHVETLEHLSDEPIFHTYLHEFDAIPLMSQHPFIHLDFLFIFVSMISFGLTLANPIAIPKLVLKLTISYLLLKLIDFIYIRCFSISGLKMDHAINLYHQRVRDQVPAGRDGLARVSIKDVQLLSPLSQFTKEIEEEANITARKQKIIYQGLAN